MKTAEPAEITEQDIERVMWYMGRTREVAIAEIERCREHDPDWTSDGIEHIRSFEEGAGWDRQAKRMAKIARLAQMAQVALGQQDVEQIMRAEGLSGMTEQEERVMAGLADAWAVFGDLPDGTLLPTERDDFARAIHQAQQILALRVVRREHPEYWRWEF